MAEKFRNHSRHKTFVNTGAGNGLVEVPPGDEVEVEGERRIELARQNPRLELVGEKKTKSQARKKAEKKASRKRSAKTSRRRAARKPPAKGKSKARKTSEKKTGTVTSDQVPKP